ncbi:MAG: CHAD domain-containing protein [Bacillota bacterium]
MKTASLHDYIARLIRSLGKLVPLALDQWDEKAIHDARVATRRLKSVLSLLAPALSSDRTKQLKKTTRKLRRRLGALRDADVMLGHLQELSVQQPSDLAIQWVQGRLMQEREELREKCRQKLSASRVMANLTRAKPLEEQVQELGTVPARLLSEQLPTQLAEFSEQAGHLVRAVAGGNHAAQVKDPHALRIATKALRYTLELAPAAGFPLPSTVLKSLKQMQDALGLWHDYVVLGERILRLTLDSGVPYHDPALYEGLLDLSRLVSRRAQRQLHRFVSLWKERGLQLRQDICGAFCIALPLAADTSVESASPEVPRETLPGSTCRSDGQERSI